MTSSVGRQPQISRPSGQIVDEAREFSAEEASRVVSEVARYEEGLTARVVGLTMMAWGCVTFGLFFVSFALAARGSGVPVSVGLPAFFLVILASILFTNQLWRWRAMSTDLGFRPWKIWTQGLILLVVGMGLMIWIDDAVLRRTDSSVSLAFVATLLLGYLGVRLQRASWQRTPWALYGAAGLAVVDVALVLWAPHSLPSPDGWAHLLAAMATSAAIFVPGYLYFWRG